MAKLAKVEFICTNCHQVCEGYELAGFGTDPLESVEIFIKNMRERMLSDFCILCEYSVRVAAEIK